MAPDPRDRAHEPGLRRHCVLQLLDRGGPTDREELLDQARLGAARAGDIERACGRRRRRGESNRIRALSSVDRTAAASPCRTAFMRERALPAAVRGPVLFRAFLRLASICRVEVMRPRMRRLRSGACVD